MSKDITVLAPNGRRQTVKCNLNTTILQILEEVCIKQGFDPSCYNLTHHNKVLDLTNTVRFSNLPNKASLEMVETERKREENDVTIALQLENDERRTGQFKPQSLLYEVLQTLASSELPGMKHPTVVYMRREVHGKPELEKTTLRQLGLTGGRAVLRLIDKSLKELRTQANVSSVLPSKPIQPEKPYRSTLDANKTVLDTKDSGTKQSITLDDSSPGPSNVRTFTQSMNPIKLIKDEIKRSANVNTIDESEEQREGGELMEVDEPIKMCSSETSTVSRSESLKIDEEVLQRRLNIEQEVNFLGENKAIAFEQSSSEPELPDLPDDFYDLTVDEVRRLYHELRQSVTALNNAPLLTAEQRATQNNSEKRGSHKNVVVRVQFPDRMVLQGVFEPCDTIQQVYAFTRLYLQDSYRPFHLFTTPSRETLDPSQSLKEAGFAPGVLMHFRWADSAESMAKCLKQSVYENATPSDAAAMLASKYRAPARQKREVPQQLREPQQGPSSNKDGKLPKWLKLRP